MSSERTPEVERLYQQGMAHFRAAEWHAAVEAFRELRAISTAYPEIDTLLADALLKIEVERTTAPQGAQNPSRRRFPVVRLLIAAVALLLVGGLLLAIMRPAPPTPTPTPLPTSMVQLPSPAPTTPTPTITPQPTDTPAPTATPAPTSTPAPTAVPQPGTLLVRMAEGQTLTRTVGTIEIILDASGSMLARIENRTRIDIAHEALTALVERLPERTNVALRTYGHRRGGDCNDVELVAPLAPLDRAALIERIRAIQPAPNGRTPIGLSLQQVTEDLKDATGEMLVVLVSDGEETCDKDPAQIAQELHTANPRLRIAVIGFSVGPEESRARLSAIAQNGGGSYFDAGDAPQLVEALQQAVTLTYRVLDANGVEVFQGPLGTAKTLPGGRYRVEISAEKPISVQDVEVGDQQTTTIEVSEQDGQLKANLIPPDDAP